MDFSLWIIREVLTLQFTFFSKALTSHLSHDIVLLCVDYHEISYSTAEKYKRQVSAKFGIPLFVDDLEKGVSHLQLRIAVLRHGSKMPKERREEVELVIKNYYEGRYILFSSSLA